MLKTFVVKVQFLATSFIFVASDIILDGLDSVDLNKKYFRICNDGYKNPAVFEYRLITQSGKEYSYGIAISYVEKKILSEWLIRIEKSGAETYIFNRKIK